MGAPIRRHWHHISHWPFLGFLRGHGAVSQPPQAMGQVALDKVPVTFTECEDTCEPTAEQLAARERERAERFKGDQLLPIMGFGGGSPSPPS